jgi:hypothetical protein
VTHKHHAKPYERYCLLCGGSFMSNKRSAKFCNSTHQSAYAARRRAFVRILKGIRTVER